MSSDLQRAKRLAFWHMFGAGLLVLIALFMLGLAQEALIHFFFY